MLKFHEKHGDIVRTGPNQLSLNGNFWPEVFGLARSGKPEFSHWDDFYQHGDKSNQSLFPADKDNHRRQRRVIAHAFSDAAIKEQETLIKKYVDMLFDHLRSDAVQGQPTDMLKWYNFTTFDIIGDLVFGEPFDCLSNSNYHPWVDAIFGGIKSGTQDVALMKMPWLRWLLAFMVSKEDLQKRIDNKEMSKEKTNRRLALGPAPNGRKDIMTYILRHNDEKGMTHAEVHGNAEALISAGSETTATALSGLTYYITTNPQALKRIQEEVRTSFATEDDITMTSTAQLKYLHACIEETMRCYPSVAETPPRVSPGEYVGGHYIPKGVSDIPHNLWAAPSLPQLPSQFPTQLLKFDATKTDQASQTQIVMHQWAIYHNPSNFAQPDAFKPERFLSPDHPFYDPQFSADKKTTFQPFSFGPRNCVGKNLAYAELRLIAARLFWNFDFELQPESRDWPDRQKAFLVWEKIPLWVQLKQVERN